MKMGMQQLQGSLLAVLLVACGSSGPGAPGNDWTDGKNALIRFAEEPPGVYCLNGGTLIRFGIDANSNGTLEDSEVTSSAYSCNGASGGATSRALVKLDAEPAGSNCAQGGTRVSSGLDANGNGKLESDEETSSFYACNGIPSSPSQGLYSTKWAASSGADATGEIAAGFWFNTGRKVSIVKTSAASRLKLTVSDNLAAGNGANGGSGHYRVRMNGRYMSPDCVQNQYVSNAAGWANYYFFPFATVCLTDALPVGLYEFEAWGYSTGGSAHIGGGVNQPLMLVEELLSTAAYRASLSGTISSTTSTTFQQASGRALTYRKRSSSTLLKVTLADTFRVAYTRTGGSGVVMIRMDGQDTTCFSGQYDAQGTGGDFHHPIVMTCVLPGVAAGTHTFGVWIRSEDGAGVYMGRERSYPLLMVEEIASQNVTYTNGSSVSGELSGDWAEVAARQVQHTVSAVGKTLRVTYSDNFRGTAGCRARWGLYQLSVDGQPTYCINGQNSSNASTNNQDHHHPVNHVCLVRNLLPGPHTFAIWSTTKHPWDGTTCGSNLFGWNRGQNLLLVEELP